MPIYGLGNIVPVFDCHGSVSSVGGTTSETSLYSKLIPGNTLGENGCLRISINATFTNSANSKVLKVKYGGTIFFTHSVATQSVYKYAPIEIRNRNATNSQVSDNGTAGGLGAATESIGSIDTTADQVLTITGQTSLETGFAATSCTRASNVVTVNKTGHGLNTGEYAQVAGATPSTFDADPVQITRVDADNFTYSNTGANESTTVQPTIKRYSVCQINTVCVEVMR